MKGFGVAVLMFMLLNLAITCNAQLRTGFYWGKCGKNSVEGLIRGVVQARLQRDPTVAAALLRLQFHDCFVTGCDASLLLDGPKSEKTAFPNLSVRGYDIIEEAKLLLERTCPVPKTVSCADIIAVATRDAVFLSRGMNYRVQTGRRDGFVSSAANVNLPSPFITVKASIDAFKAKGLNKTDMVLLLGAHTVGITHCPLIFNRLYNYNNTRTKDPTMKDTEFNAWSKLCPNPSSTNPKDIATLKKNKPIALDQTVGSIKTSRRSQRSPRHRSSFRDRPIDCWHR
ncbi:hypothetical protein MKW94_003075 [Papaver nudicaule]|uniref:Peroxidase n=1 Tax=Papaver nudicaule TaxID=74823 RepID=A0AA41V5C1_PAPNU|nr:hypothetical protein [Papaver nudicaule]